MNDYRDKYCKIDGKTISKCIAQDFRSGLLYFPLKEETKFLDCGCCKVPSFPVNFNRVEIIDIENIDVHDILLHTATLE
ncbi:MAG: hypothetical protein JM58_09400 [Peptococcaceae bacterium BICA1-8]|nr:MAG: hypothetical protein JM58_09400 [Peptococcaceae bacterium BICA1-8]